MTTFAVGQRVRRIGEPYLKIAVGALGTVHDTLDAPENIVVLWDDRPQGPVGCFAERLEIVESALAAQKLGWSDEDLIPRGTRAIFNDPSSLYEREGYTVGMEVIVIKGDTDGTALVESPGLDSIWVDNRRLLPVADFSSDLLRAFQGG